MSASAELDRNPLFGRQTYSPFILLAQLVEQERIELSAPALQMLVASLGTCCPVISGNNQQETYICFTIKPPGCYARAGFEPTLNIPDEVTLVYDTDKVLRTGLEPALTCLKDK